MFFESPKIPDEVEMKRQRELQSKIHTYRLFSGGKQKRGKQQQLKDAKQQTRKLTLFVRCLMVVYQDDNEVTAS